VGMLTLDEIWRSYTRIIRAFNKSMNVKFANSFDEDVDKIDNLKAMCRCLDVHRGVWS